MSQLRLAASASMSPRYVSFVETGRSRPSRGVVLRLADALDVPLRERNRLLVAAGLAPAYADRGLDAAELAPYRRVVSALLAKQEPYPAFVFDRAYRILDANAAGRRFVAPGGDWLRSIFAPESPLRGLLENAAELGWAVHEMLVREAQGSPMVEECVARLEGYLCDLARPPRAPEGSFAGTAAARFRFGDRVVSTVSAVARFGVARDVTLDELRVELLFPADDGSAAFFAELALQPPGAFAL